jgi:hypothetical protein
VNRRPTTPPDALVKRICYTTYQCSSSSTIPACQHGKQLEPEARRTYVEMCDSKGYNVNIEEKGLIVDKRHSWLGASVDGVVKVTYPNQDTGLLEIKCPYVNLENDSTAVPKDVVELCLTRNNFYLSFDGNSIVMNKKHNYYFQVQTQLGILKLTWCDFMVYYKVKDLEICSIFIYRIEFDKELYENYMLPLLYGFYVKGVVAEVITRRVKNGLKLYLILSSTFIMSEKNDIQIINK